MQVVATAGKSILVTGIRERLEKGGTGAQRIASGIDPGFHLPFSIGQGIGVGR